MNKRVDEKYLKKHKDWYNRSEQYIRNTIFAENFYTNQDINLLKPIFLNENDEMYAWNIYSISKNDKYRKMIFDHYLTLMLYLSAYQLTKYRYQCNDIEEYYSYNMETLWRVITRYNINSGVKFSTYFINESNFLIKRHLLKMYSFDLISDTMRERFILAYSRIYNEGLTIKDIEAIPQRVFQRTYGLSKKLFNYCYNHRICSLDLIIDSLGIEDVLISKKYIEALKDNINFEDDLINKFLFEQIDDYVKRTCKSINYKIWKEYIFGGNNVSLDLVGKQYGITRERVRQIVKAIQEKLIKYFKHKKI